MCLGAWALQHNNALHFLLGSSVAHERRLMQQATFLGCFSKDA